MNCNIFFLTFIFIQLFLFAPSVVAKPIDSVDMRLSTNQGQTRVDHRANFPMLLKVIISTLGEPVSIKKSNSIKDSIHFFAQDKSAGTLLIEVKPMACCSTEKEAVVDQKNSLFLQFGIEPDQWSKIKAKTLKLSAEMKIPDAGSPALKSNTIDIVLLEAEALPIKSLKAIQDNYEAGSFFVLQNDYAKVEQYAKNLESTAASLAWELRGDAFLGQGKKTEAKNAYRKSLASDDVVLPEQMREITAAKLYELSGEKENK